MVKKSVGVKTSKEEYRPQHSTSHNSSETSYYGPLMEAENHHPTHIPLFQRWRFSFPIDINFGWPRKSVTHPYQHKYWNILLFDFHYHSTHIKFPKINSFLSIQIRTFSSQFHRHFVFTNQIVWTLCFLFINIIVKFFTCLLVWFAVLCFVLSLQPYAYLLHSCYIYNISTDTLFGLLLAYYVEYGWGGDSRLPSKGRSKKFQTSCVMLNAAVDILLSRSYRELKTEPFI